MPAIKLTGFKGIAPKTSPELVQDQAGQTAHNCKLFSGDIVPYPEPIVAGNTGQTGDVKTIYPLRHPTTGVPVWLSWDTEVNVATPAFDNSTTEQRFYYTGDGVPKVSTYALATSGSLPFPNDYYQLGLPLPGTELLATAVAFTAKTISSVARDSSGIVTYITSTAHGLETGAVAAISGFTYYAASYSRSGQTITVTLANHGIADGSTVFLTRTSGGMTDGVYVTSGATTNTFDVTDPESGSTSGNVKVDTRGYNATGVEITKVDSTTFTAFLPGFEQSTYTVTGATVTLGGTPGLRTYVYTWITPWDEESIASDPSDDMIVREGQTVTVSNLPTTPPSVPAKNFIRGIKVYRTLSGIEDAAYHRIATCWFPQSIAAYARETNVATLTTDEPHNFIEEDRFKLSGCTDATFDVTDGVVVDVPDRYTFTYMNAGTDVSETADTAGTLFHDIAQTDDDPAVYWGDSTYDITDNYNAKYLQFILNSTEFDAPPEDLRGLKAIQNNILCGFVNNRLYLSEPDYPHAWPEEYIKTLDYNVVAIEPVSGVGTLVLTEGYPYLLSGNDPAILSVQRIDALYPCVSSRGVVAMNTGIIWPTHEGLAIFSPGTGARLISNQIYEHDSWTTAFDPDTIVASYYSEAYFASHSTGGFIARVESVEQVEFVTCDVIFDAVYSDLNNDKVYFCVDGDSNVFEWDDLDQPNQTAEWKSKVIITKDYTNFGAARVIADYGTALPTWDTWDVAWGSSNGGATWNGSDALTFKMWADKELVCEYEINSKQPFRLPTGFRSDTFEFGVESDIRVRAIHVAETVVGLKEA